MSGAGPAALPRRITHFLRRQAFMAGFRRIVAGTPPVRIEASGEVELRVLSGKRVLWETIAALKSFYRFSERKYALVVHDDGSLRPADLRRLEEHFPGVRFVPREEADRRIGELFERRGLRNCAQLRRTLVLTPKVFDLQLFAGDTRILYFDSDILYRKRPDALFEALASPPAEWRDRYNEDVAMKLADDAVAPAYSWSRAQVRAHVGIELLPQVNSGLMLLHRPEPAWDLFERCLEMPVAPGREWYVEQSLIAIDMSRTGAQPLPSNYDVCFRHAYHDVEFFAAVNADRVGHPVVTQHYCGGSPMRGYFYTHFVSKVAPEIIGARRAGPIARRALGIAGTSGAEQGLVE